MLKDILNKLIDLWNDRHYRIGEWASLHIAASGTLTGAVDLGGHFAYLQVVLPTITSAQLELQVSKEFDGTYQDLGQDALTAGSTGAFNDTWLLGGWRFIKVKSSVAQTAAELIEVRGITY